MAIPYALRDLLPAELSPELVRSALRCSGSPGTTSGETWLIELAEGAMVLTRASLLDPATRVALAAEHALELVREDYQTCLRVRPSAGEAFEVRPSLLEVEDLSRLLARVGERRASEQVEPPTQAEPPNPVDVRPFAPARAASSVERERALARVHVALSERGYTVAAQACRELALLGGESAEDREAWSDSADVLDRLAQAKPVAAVMVAYAGELADEIHDALGQQLAAELELAREPLLAMAVLDWLWDSSLAETEQRRLAHELDSRVAEDEPERGRALAKRMLESVEPAEVGDLRVLRARVHALRDLDQPSEAFAALESVLAREPKRFETRIIEAELLGELGEHAARRARLELLIREFPTRADPAVVLATELAEDPDADPEQLAEAGRWFALALEREFDELVVLDYAELLERTGRFDEAIAVLETSHGRAEGTPWQEDFARALVRLSREHGRVEQAERWVEAVEVQVVERERGYAVAAIALMIILLAVVLVFVMLVG